MKKIIILVGIPGSGKGTQARILASRHGYAHISTGDLVRALAVDSSASTEDKAKAAVTNSGQLVSDDLIYTLTFSEIEKYLSTGKGVVLDGAIRNVFQAQAYQRFFENHTWQDDVVVIELHLSNETAYRRLTKRKVCSSCGHILPYSQKNDKKIVCAECGGQLFIRADDTEEKIQKRLKEQGNIAIAPILDFYRAKGLLVTVDGEQEIVDINLEVEHLIV